MPVERDKLSREPRDPAITLKEWRQLARKPTPEAEREWRSSALGPRISAPCWDGRHAACRPLEWACRCKCHRTPNNARPHAMAAESCAVSSPRGCASAAIGCDKEAA
jgi:hypothetical protein